MNAPYLACLYRCQTEARKARNEAGDNVQRFMAESLLSQIDRNIETLEKWQSDHDKVTKQTHDEEDRARLEFPYKPHDHL